MRPVVAIVLCIVVGIAFAVFMSAIDKQTATQVRKQEEAKRMALAAIKPGELAASDVTLDGPEFFPNEFLLKGDLTNNSGFPLKYIEFEVAIIDCQGSTASAAAPDSNACTTVGQSTVGVSIDVPPHQRRVFQTTAIRFDGLPDQGRCVENAPSTWHHEAGANAECPKGRRFTWRITEIEAGGFGYF